MSNDARRKVYRETDSYICRIEETRGVLFVHIEIKQMTKKMIKELVDEFDAFKLKVKLAGYDYLHTYSATPKFYKHFKGYQDIGPMNWKGQEYRVLRWELN